MVNGPRDRCAVSCGLDAPQWPPDRGPPCTDASRRAAIDIYFYGASVDAAVVELRGAMSAAAQAASIVDAAKASQNATRGVTGRFWGRIYGSNAFLF